MAWFGTGKGHTQGRIAVSTATQDDMRIFMAFDAASLCNWASGQRVCEMREREMICPLRQMRFQQGLWVARAMWHVGWSGFTE